MAAAGILNNDEVDIQGGNERLVIQLRERTTAQVFDKLFAKEPGVKVLLALVQDSLTKAIAETDKTTGQLYSLLERL